MPRTLSIKTAVAAVSVSLLLVSCAKQRDTIRIGVGAPMTGSQAKMGTDILNGVLLSVQEWNAKGGVLGKQIEVVKRDDEANEQVAKNIAYDFANQNVAGVIGHYNSGCMIPASEVYKEYMIPVITPAATNPFVTDRKLPNVFRICGRDDVQGRVAADYAVDVMQATRIAALHDKTAYGEGLARYFKEQVEARLGPDAMVYYGGFPNKESNFKPYLTSMAEKNPQVYFFGGIYDQAGPLVVQSKDLGIQATFISGDGVIDPEFVKTAQACAEGSLLTFAEFLPFSPDFEKYPRAKAFNEAYTPMFGTPGPYSLYAYEAANVLLSSIAVASTVDGAAVSAAIRGNEHDTILGKIRFDEKGDIVGSFYVVWMVKDGDFVLASRL